MDPDSISGGGQPEPPHAEGPLAGSQDSQSATALVANLDVQDLPALPVAVQAGTAGRAALPMADSESTSGNGHPRAAAAPGAPMDVLLEAGPIMAGSQLEGVATSAPAELRVAQAGRGGEQQWPATLSAAIKSRDPHTAMDTLVSTAPFPSDVEEGPVWSAPPAFGQHSSSGGGIIVENGCAVFPHSGSLRGSSRRGVTSSRSTTTGRATFRSRAFQRSLLRMEQVDAAIAAPGEGGHWVPQQQQQQSHPSLAATREQSQLEGETGGDGPTTGAAAANSASGMSVTTAPAVQRAAEVLQDYPHGIRQRGLADSWGADAAVMLHRADGRRLSGKGWSGPSGSELVPPGNAHSIASERAVGRQGVDPRSTSSSLPLPMVTEQTSTEALAQSMLVASGWAASRGPTFSDRPQGVTEANPPHLSEWRPYRHLAEVVQTEAKPTMAQLAGIGVATAPSTVTGPSSQRHSTDLWQQLWQAGEVQRKHRHQWHAPQAGALPLSSSSSTSSGVLAPVSSSHGQQPLRTSHSSPSAPASLQQLRLSGGAGASLPESAGAAGASLEAQLLKQRQWQQLLLQQQQEQELELQRRMQGHLEMQQQVLQRTSTMPIPIPARHEQWSPSALLQRAQPRQPAASMHLVSSSFPPSDHSSQPLLHLQRVALPAAVAGAGTALISDAGRTIQAALTAAPVPQPSSSSSQAAVADAVGLFARHSSGRADDATVSRPQHPVHWRGLVHRGASHWQPQAEARGQPGVLFPRTEPPPTSTHTAVLSRATPAGGASLHALPSPLAPPYTPAAVRSDAWHVQAPTDRKGAAQALESFLTAQLAATTAALSPNDPASALASSSTPSPSGRGVRALLLHLPSSQSTEGATGAGKMNQLGSDGLLLPGSRVLSAVLELGLPGWQNSQCEWPVSPAGPGERQRSPKGNFGLRSEGQMREGEVLAEGQQPSMRSFRQRMPEALAGPSQQERAGGGALVDPSPFLLRHVPLPEAAALGSGTVRPASAVGQPEGEVGEGQGDGVSEVQQAAAKRQRHGPHRAPQRMVEEVTAGGVEEVQAGRGEGGERGGSGGGGGGGGGIGGNVGLSTGGGEEATEGREASPVGVDQAASNQMELPSTQMREQLLQPQAALDEMIPALAQLQILVFPEGSPPAPSMAAIVRAAVGLILELQSEVELLKLLQTMK